MKAFIIRLILVILMIFIASNMINCCLSILVDNEAKAFKHFIYAVVFSIVGILVCAKYKKMLN